MPYIALQSHKVMEFGLQELKELNAPIKRIKTLDYRD